jgi:hypothetical protein
MIISHLLPRSYQGPRNLKLKNCPWGSYVSSKIVRKFIGDHPRAYEHNYELR